MFKLWLQETFSRPMALMKLGMFLRDRQALASSKPSKAFVIFGMVKEDGEGERLCPVVCVPAKPKITDTEVGCRLTHTGDTARSFCGYLLCARILDRANGG